MASRPNSTACNEVGNIKMRSPLQARNLVRQSSAISRAKQLAQAYADEAKNVLEQLPQSEVRDALEVFVERIVGRKN
ncbi:hypothetical protein D9756_010007 [Leucocoprinus leucothites]|uniref:Polyprenyl synthetase n=1 Tax=Leucocoprinus leucothites TaxID=201217 RepID=A0A8H5CRA9_9AGAR|nr:hypothetical protein D9756_010007 [Leucoagaricus leucothites]